MAPRARRASQPRRSCRSMHAGKWGTTRPNDDGYRDEILAAVLSSVLEYAYAWEYRPDGSSRPIAESRPWFEFLDVDDHPDPLSCWIASMHPDDRSASEDILARQLAGIDGEATFRAIRRDGSTRWLLERWRCRPGKRTAWSSSTASSPTSARCATPRSRSPSRARCSPPSSPPSTRTCTAGTTTSRAAARPSTRASPRTCSCARRPTVDPVEPWRTTLVPEDREGARPAAERRDAGLDGVMEWRCRGEDGEVRWMRDSWRCGSFRDGRRRIYGIVVDVSETVTAREDAAETRAHLDAVVDAIDDYVYAWAYEPGGDVAVSFESVPQARFLGVDDPGDDAVDLWRARVHPGRPRGLRRPHRPPAPLPGRRRRVPALRPGHGWRWVYDRSHARRVPDGRVLAEGIVSDVTRLREAQERLREHDAMFRTLADALPMSMWTEDADGRVDFVNAQAEELWCLRRDDFATPAWHQRVHPEDRGRVSDTTGRLEDSEVEFRIVLPDGSTRDVASRRRVVRRPNGDVIGFVGTDVDVTAERAAAADLHAHVRRLDQANAELEAARLEADVRSRTDALTGLANRRHFTEELVAELRRAAHEGGPPAVLLLDIDRFKAVNDTYGHAVGDVVLAGVAEPHRGRAAHRQRGGALGRRGVRGAGARRGRRRGAARRRRAHPAGRRRAPHPDARRRAAPVRLRRRRALDRRRAGRRRAGGRGRPRALRRQAPRPRPDAPRGRPDRRGPAGRGAGGDAHRAGAGARRRRVREGMPELHCQQVAELSAAIARELGLPPAMVLRCRLGGLAARRRQGRDPRPHPGQAGPAGRRRVARHASATRRSASSSCRAVPGLREARRGVRHHHERWDGAGYPDGLAAEDIPIEARIVAVADAYSAITSDRVLPARPRARRGARPSCAARRARTTTRTSSRPSPGCCRSTPGRCRHGCGRSRRRGAAAGALAPHATSLARSSTTLRAEPRGSRL